MYKFGKPGTPHWHINLVTEHDLNIKITARSPALQHPFINDNSFSSPFPTVLSLLPPPPSPPPRQKDSPGMDTGCSSRARRFAGLSRFKSDTEIGIQRQIRNCVGEDAKLWERNSSGPGQEVGGWGGGGRLRSSEQRGPAVSGALPRDPTGWIVLTSPPLTTAQRGMRSLRVIRCSFAAGG